jgi:PIN domain nuclease of toxin-antitoxin system
MQIKAQLGKLKLTLRLADIIASQQQTHNVEVLPVNLSHVLALENLPEHHKDPFDRILISQALVEGATLVSRDKVFEQYAVNVEW